MVEPGMTMSILLPRLAMELVTFCLTPMPMEIMAMTAPTPMIIPSIVRIERSLLPSSAVTAICTLSLNNIHNHTLSGIPRQLTVADEQLAAGTSGNFWFVRDEDDCFMFLMERFKNAHDFFC